MDNQALQGVSTLGMTQLPKILLVIAAENGYIIRVNNVHPQKEYIAATIEDVKAKVEELLNDTGKVE